MKNKKKGNSHNRYLGTYQISNDQTLVGELLLDGENSILQVHSNEVFSPENTTTITGNAYTGEHITLISVVLESFKTRHLREQLYNYQADIHPNYVAIGSTHLDPESPCIKEITFTATDLLTLFYDFDAFSTLIRPEAMIDLVLSERRQMRPVEAGDNPIIAYYTGKGCVIDAPTPFGKFSVNHWPIEKLGGPSGVSVDNRMMVSILLKNPATFAESIGLIHDIYCFLSTIAGRTQGIEDIRIVTQECNLEGLSVVPSMGWKAGEKSDYFKPAPSDVPLDPIRAPEEFKAVLANWIERHNNWHSARKRYIGCLSKGRHYDIDRLVAAANMFDILPADAVPTEVELPPELATAQKESRALFRELPDSIERQSILIELKRLGKPSLAKKVVHRVEIVERQLGDKLPHLRFAAITAVKLRNYFVHGNLPGLKYENIEPYFEFLTDTLEFVFAASDLIDAGWSAQGWLGKMPSTGHSFGRYLHGYKTRVKGLIIAAEKEADLKI